MADQDKESEVTAEYPETPEPQNTPEVASDAYDFSSLPEVAWVQVMQYLNIKERFYLSLTCQTLYEHFHHPSLWNSINVLFNGGATNFRLSNTFLPDRFVHMFSKFGHLYQHLTIRVNGHLSTFDDESREILTKLSEVCRLESLTIEAGKLISKFDIGGITPFKSDLMIFISFVKNAFRLKHFNLLSWPMYPVVFNNTDLNIFNALMENENLKDLESLSLFWRKDSSWSEREPLLPSPSYLTSFLPNLKNISQLSLRSPMLSEDLLTLLASPDRAKLKRLQIYVTFSAFNRAFSIPEISSSVWKSLVCSSPALEVECSVMSQVPFPELSLLLNPDVPLVSLTFLRYARCNGQIIESVADKFPSNLREFLCYGDCTESDQELIGLVKKCKNLKKLKYHGTIKCSTIISIVTQKEGPWSVLEFVDKNIDTLDDNPLFNDDEEIIKKNEEGEYILVDLQRFHRSDDNREETIQQLCDAVSDVLGQSWAPL